MSACLIFLIVTPKALFVNRRRKLLFVCILFVLTGFYIGTEVIDPLVYALHLTPVSLALAVMFEGLIPGFFTWAAFLVCGIAVVGNDWVATAAGTTMMLLLGMLFHYQRLAFSKYGEIALSSVLLVSVHLAVYLVVYLLRGYTVNMEQLTVALTGTYLSTLLVSYTYYQVKKQEKLREQLFNAEKYQMIGQLAASISHEIRNPLTTTRGFLQMMGKPNVSPEALERYRLHAIEGIEHASSIISDYLNYSKPTVEEPGPIDIRTEIDGLIPWISPLSVMSGIEIRIKHLDVEPLYIVGEQKKFQQCLLNLLKNAIEAMPDGGQLTLRTWSDGERVCLQIADTGSGMNEQQLKRIGLPYFTTKEKGTGLGLMVVISLVQVMGGEISFRSKPGHGTKCDLRFKSYRQVESGSA
ncbi:HAMP domain-containing histidine kinase [Paenibacillus sp. sptzw28]|nr:HAMP domain-containing histidine kinase [Paenibacillus sp. sptzw28]